MSLSVSGSNQNNPFSWQSLWQQQGSSTSGTQTQSDPLSQLLAEIGQTGSGAASTASRTTSSGYSATSSSGTSSQFGSQTLQALLALQSNSSSAQSLASQFGNDVTGDDPLASLQSQSSQGGHHHHHQSAANGTNGQTTSTSTDTSSSSSLSSESGNSTGNNAFYQWLQTQAQLAPAATTQNVATA